MDNVFNGFNEMAQLFKILSSPNRLKLLNFISFCPRKVEECVTNMEMSYQNTSLHLIALANAGLLDFEQIKNSRYYFLKKPEILDLIYENKISSQYCSLPPSFMWEEEISRLSHLVQKEEVYLVDLRTIEETSYIPVPLVFNFPDNQFEKFVPEKKKTIVFCRGPWCLRMAEGVNKFRSLGIDAVGAGFTAIQLRQLAQNLQR